MGVTKVTRNYQITLPKDVREMERINVGDKLIITVEKTEIVLRKLKGRLIDRTFGSWGKGKSGLKYTREIRDEAEKREKRLGL